MSQSPGKPPSLSRTLVLDSLPTEIQDVIFHYIVFDSTTTELKDLRQCNRYFRDRADIYLFHTIHLSASTASLERLIQVSENDRLNVHVRELVFHRGTFFGHKMARASGHFEVRARDYDSFETYVVKSSTKAASEGLLRISQCYANFNEELQFESRFNQDMTWRSTLRKPCSKFIKLEKLTTLSPLLDLESKYLRKRCALTHQTWTPNYFAPYEAFEVCGRGFKPKALSMDSVNGEDFATVIANIRGGISAVAGRFANLKHLRLGFSETVTNLQVEGTWDVFIQSCVSLRSLSLDFSSFYSTRLLKEPESFPQKFMKVLLEQGFPKLESLHLTSSLMAEDDFVNFLQRHQNCLTSLKLSDWSIPVDASDLATGSIIRAFWKIGKLPMSELKSVELEGEFSNRIEGFGWTAARISSGRCQGTQSTRSDRENSLLAEMEAYMSNRGLDVHPFPFAVDQAKMDKAKTGQELLALDNRTHALWTKIGDRSFRWYDGLVDSDYIVQG